MIRRETSGPDTGENGSPAPRLVKDPSRGLLFGEKSAEVSSFFVPPATGFSGRGRLRRFHLGKGRESQQQSGLFRRVRLRNTSDSSFPGSDAPAANVPVWEGCRVAERLPLPGRSDPETPRYPPATIRSDTGRRCALSGGVPLLLPRFSVLYSPKDHPVVQTCARQGTCRQTSHPVFSWKNGMKTCEFFVVIL